ncbi:MAG TPA: LysM peptidoglycan-binding domain-containing protein [Acidothermaceae bacterium]
MTAVLDFDFAPLADPEVDPAIFAPLPITAVEPFPRPRLRLVCDEPGRRGERPAVSARRAPLRLTRRGRLVAVLGLVLLASLLSALVLALAMGPASGRSAAAPPAAGAAGSTVVVQPGDTLWAIASRVAPKADPRVVVQQIIDRNGLASASVQAGQLLVLPS